MYFAASFDNIKEPESRIKDEYIYSLLRNTTDILGQAVFLFDFVDDEEINALCISLQLLMDSVKDRITEGIFCQKNRTSLKLQIQ